MTDGADRPPAWTPPPGDESSAAEASPGDAATATSREAAREKARELREQHRRRERARRWGWGLGIAAIVIGAGAAVAAVLLLLPSPAPVGPLNMPSDAVTITEDGTVHGPGLTGGGVVAHPASTPDPGVLSIRLYVDFLSADSGEFLRQEGESLAAWTASGTATLEIHPVSMLTTQSAGTQYSLRAANAFGCVVNYAPDAAFDYMMALAEDQPTEGSEGLTDEELAARADAVIGYVTIEPDPIPTPDATASAGDVSDVAQQPDTIRYANVMPRVERCITSQEFRPWVIAATERAVKGPLPGTDLPSVSATPTILVQGRNFVFDPLSDANEFPQFVLQVAGETFATPEPTATATPTPAG